MTLDKGFGRDCGGCPSGRAPSAGCPGGGCCGGAGGLEAPLPRLVVFAGGEILDEAAVARWTEGADLIVAADSGLGRAFACGLTPDVVVGDLDSALAADVEAARSAGIPIRTVSPIKDETDLELAVDHGLAQLAVGVAKNAHIILAGITGGRLDHTLAAVGLMARLARDGHCVEAGDGLAWATVLGGWRRATRLRGRPGEYLSLIPLLSDVTGVTLTGLKYPLDRATLPWGKSLGVSNEFAKPEGYVEMEDGWLLVVKPGERFRVPADA